MKASSRRGIPALFAGLLISIGLSMHADIFYVSVSGAGFSPSCSDVRSWKWRVRRLALWRAGGFELGPRITIFLHEFVGDMDCQIG